jgi:1,4-alpha-glucan branching enzyme
MTTTLTAQKKSTSSCGIRQLKDGTAFIANFPDASVVQLAGDFNNWQPERTTMRRSQKDGLWKVKLPLHAGTYRYRFVVDGRWQHDPCNKATENNPYGELNSVVHVS